MLNYFHRRGKLVYFGGGGATGNSSCGGIGSDDDELLQRLAIIDCSWFIQKIGRLLMTSTLSSRCTAAEAIQTLADPAADNWLRPRIADDPTASTPTHPAANGAMSLTGRWLLSALDRLEMCVYMHDPVRCRRFLYRLAQKLANVRLWLAPYCPRRMGRRPRRHAAT